MLVRFSVQWRMWCRERRTANMIWRGACVSTTPAATCPNALANCGRSISGDAKEMAREFWRRYAKSPEVRDQFDDVQDRSAGRQGSCPSSPRKFSRIDDREWTRQARGYVEKALSAGMTLSTLLVGVNAETEAAYGRDSPPGRRRRGPDPLRPHPVRNPGDRDRLLHPSRDHHHPQGKRAGPVAPGRAISTAG